MDDHYLNTLTAAKVGAFMKKLRLQENFTQKQLAAAIGVTQGTLSKMENGLLIPDIIEWTKFCEFARLGDHRLR